MKERTVALGIVQLDIFAHDPTQTVKPTLDVGLSSALDGAHPASNSAGSHISDAMEFVAATTVGGDIAAHLLSSSEAFSSSPDVVSATNGGAFFNAATELLSDHAFDSNLAAAPGLPTVPLPNDEASDLSGVLLISGPSDFDVGSALLNHLNGGHELILGDSLSDAESPSALLNTSVAWGAPPLGHASAAPASVFPPSSSLALDANAPVAAPPPEAHFTASIPETHSTTPTVMLVGDLGQSPASIVQTSQAASGQASSGLVINITYDSSVANAPAGFESVVASVVNFYESEFTNPITLNIHVGWGEVDGLSLSSGDLGESDSFLQAFSYSQIRNALIADASSSTQLSAVSSLPASAPFNGTYYLTLADATALGLLSGSTILDGYVGFGSSVSWDYDNSNGVAAGTYDLYGAVAHELSEVMGRISMLSNSAEFTDLDLFRFSAAGARASAGTTTAYFSADNGNTSIDYFNSNSSGDFGDWASSAGNDSFDAFGGSGVVDPITVADIKTMNVLGYNVVIPTVTGIVETPSSGDLNPGKSVTITLDFNTAVTVTGGTPKLTLNDGGTATYSSGSGSTALNFTYTVGAGDTNVASLAVNSVNPNGATIGDSTTNAQLSLSGLTQSGPQIDTTIPVLNAIVESPSSGAFSVGQKVVFTLDFTEVMTVSGNPTLTLNDGGIATLTGVSGNSLTFSYTVSATDNDAAALAVTAVQLNGGSIRDAAGNNANLALGGLSQTGPEITTPAAQSDAIYQAVLQRLPTSVEMNAALAEFSTLGLSEVAAAVVDTPEAQHNVYPVVQIIDLATGSLPSSAQLASWVPFVESAGLLQGQLQTNPLLDQMAEAFVASTKFGNFYNGGTAVDPNSPITAAVVSAIIHAATGISATQAQIDAWLATGQTIDQVFVDFALGDQYSAYLQGNVQNFVTSLAIQAASNGALNVAGVITPSDGLSAAQVQGAYEAVLQRAPTGAETNAALSIDGSIGNVGALAAMADSPEAQQHVYPVTQIILLATGNLPTPPQLAGWVPAVEVGTSLDQMALAFVASTAFGDTYNGGTAVNPDAPITATIVSAIIQAATGIAATQTQIDAWLATGLTVDQVFVDFALGDQYSTHIQSTVQAYLDATAINGAGLTTIDGINAAGALTLGTATAPLTGNNLTVLGGSGLLTVVASGSGDTVTELNTSTAGGTITASGNNDIVTTADGANTVTANGAHDTITLGAVSTEISITGAQTIHAAGADDTISFATKAADGTAVTWAAASTLDGGSPTAGIGANSTVNFGTNVGGGSETVVVTGDLTGATTSGGTTTAGIAMITLGNVVHAGGDQITFNNAATEALAGTSAVNVSGAGSLAQAFDVAASAAAASQSGGEIGAHTGIIDWFQYSGDTYLVEAINATASAALHSALATTDEVVKIVGIVDLGGDNLMGHTLAL